MKEPIRFTLIYSVVSIVVVVLLQIFFHPLSAEIFAYAIWLYIFYAVVSAVVFLLFGLLLRKYRLTFKVRVICYAILCLFVLNSVPLFGEKKFLTFDTIKGLLSEKIEIVDVGVHVIAIASFVISFLVVFRRSKVTYS
jgi:hypothetical protein